MKINKWIKIKIQTKIREIECQISIDSRHQGGAKEGVVEPSHVGHVSYRYLQCKKNSKKECRFKEVYFKY